MKAIMIMYDSLNRLMLEPYGCNGIPTPNFNRLAEHVMTFDCNYVGSMPCMPARRELHTGRYNFEHRGWGPLEPFDDSIPEILKNNGIFTYLSTDHSHYWEDGGATYHNRYNGFEFSRGQEGDHWKVNRDVLDWAHRGSKPESVNYFDLANREYMNCEERMPQAVTFRAGLDFIDSFHDTDNWFLQIETFDPHEPFFSQPEYKKAFAHDYDGPLGDWPPYYPVTEGEAAVNHMKKEYAALITMCDHYLGTVLDRMDQYDMWKDTLLIVNTDHGFLLGEHGWWSKSIMPIYEEISHTPLFVHDPRFPEKDGCRTSRLTQTIDLAPTILEFFGLEIPKDMEGKALRGILEKDEMIHEYVLFGYHDTQCNITDGRYVYMKAPLPNTTFYEYTLMPTHMNRLFSTAELQNTCLQDPFSFTKGCPVMKIRAGECMNDPVNFGTKLFDLSTDPGQENPYIDYEREAALANEMLRLMHMDDCPIERYARFGLPSEGTVTADDIRKLREAEVTDRIPKTLECYNWDRGAANMFITAKKLAPDLPLEDSIRRLMEQAPTVGNGRETADMHHAPTVHEGKKTITMQQMMMLLDMIPQDRLPMIWYFGMMASRTI